MAAQVQKNSVDAGIDCTLVQKNDKGNVLLAGNIRFDLGFNNAQLARKVFVELTPDTQITEDCE